MQESLQILNDIFGYSSFRDRQGDIIQSVVDGNDNLVIMPTGGGKSLCYQIPALVRDGLAIVVSPLIALMNDQVAALKQLDIAADALHSNIDEETKRRIHSDIAEGKLKMLYISPEGLLVGRFLEYLKNNNVSLFAIDEAHCVSVWGNDFRPEYVKLSRLKETFPDIPIVALTATADHATQSDIITQLKLNEPKQFLSSFERTNIKTVVNSGLKRIQQISNFLLSHQGEAGIVYCLSRKSTEKVSNDLRAQGYKVRAYHARLSADEREEVQHEFQSDEIQIVCATIAFGMGIDKPNIRWVIHYNMPKNIESYYQEIGRGGRDGKPAESLLFHSWGDYVSLKRFIDEGEATEQFKIVQSAKLERMWEFATAASCRTNLVLSYFGEYRNTKCDHCDNCLNPPELFDGTKYVQMALSAVIRSQESVSLNLLIDVLRGSNRTEVRNSGLDKIKTFGIGRDVPFLDWKHYVTQMINQGLVSIDFTDRSKLKSTPLSNPILKGESTIMLSKFIPNDKKPKVKVPKLSIDVGNADQDLLAALKAWRLGLAKSQKVPAYVIMNNKALDQISSVLPSNSSELLAVDGVGRVKLMKYGDAVLKIVKEYGSQKIIKNTAK